MDVGRYVHAICFSSLIIDNSDLAEEYDKFLADAKRLAEDVSYNQTFNTVRPLLNFWAAFTPSNEVIGRIVIALPILTRKLLLQSGIGINGVPKK